MVRILQRVPGRRTAGLPGVLLFALVPLLLAAAPANRLPPVIPPPPEAPVVGLRIIGPAGTRTSFHPDCQRSVDVESPALVGARPGYIYQFRLSNLTQGKNIALYPTIEVIGTLRLPPPLNGLQFPVPIVITDQDVEQVLAGSYITKVIALENPDRAAPVATSSDRPLETVVPPERNLLEEAWLLGRPMVVLRIGHRELSFEELAARAIPNTLLLPGHMGLGMPPVPPNVPYRCFPVTDPIHGLDWKEEEVVKDGGDVPPFAGLDAQGKLGGLNPKDTVAEYSDDCGGRQLAISNRVCLLVPRYVVVRTDIVPLGYDLLVGPAHKRVVQGQETVLMRLPPITNAQVEQPEVMKNRQRPVSIQEAQTAITLEQMLSTGLIVGQQGSQVVIGTSIKKCTPPCKPLYLCKEADRLTAEIGDVVTFTLRYSNPGGQPINDVVLNDSLTGRLEYVVGSWKSDREANFSMQENEAGSLILRWELPGKLLPGETGVITFQAKIR